MNKIAVIIVLVIQTSSFLPQVNDYTKAEENVTVSGDVFTCEILLKVKLQGRDITNETTHIRGEVRNTAGNLEGTFSTTTDNNGIANLDICSQGIHLTGGTYTFFVQGYSHLRKMYIEVTGFTKWGQVVDLSTDPSKYLIAGEMGNVDDGEINSLDITHQIRTLYKTTIDLNYNTKFDLNLDGGINDDDLDLTISNFYLTGD